MRPLAHLADPDDAIAFPAFYALTAPAIRAIARGPLHRARHVGAACHAPVGPGGCAECEATVDDLILNSFARLRGPLPTTRSGEPVRELALVREHLISPQAAYEDTAALAHVLRGPAAEGEESWLRAARAQLIHYPLSHLEERIRRDDAVRRGAAARPDRDLRQAVWATPLRTDPATLDMLIFAVFRARRGASRRDIPADLCERHGLSPYEARRQMDAALLRLRILNPAFYTANLDVEPFTGIPWAAGYAHSAHGLEREAAQETLRQLTTPGRTCRRAYEAVIAGICAAGHGDCADPVGLAMASMDLARPSARRLVRTLVSLVAAAGPDWSEARCSIDSIVATRVHREHVLILTGLGPDEAALAQVAVRS
ncbi:hypothetical protein LDL08_20085 [Nonomuraea glycinis]|uniref:Uncharacterized protein n=1 Tax=Nonomuraea glycinis TaxID=2047744 RepID=A0A918E9U0_9ACTN|nr:hypothetical protein [Nonomuraea glycinis]MCA2178493.1 hypothetical protein [Nonomuraea glycinis]GGP14105.1 hypothetical protein GCM10012278_68560 [Nonomuraea glycinis]